MGTVAADGDLTAAAEALDGADRAHVDLGPIMLVCTHGVHDTCCAFRGRPVAAALAAQWPDQVWECSHVGGDRFAPNVLVLPDGFYYGNLTPDEAVVTVQHHLTGTVAYEYLRGVVRYPPPVQAAVVAAYAHCPPLGPGQITVRRVNQIGPHAGHGSETIVDLEVPTLRADFRAEMLSVRRPLAKLTCRAARETPATSTGFSVSNRQVRMDRVAGNCRLRSAQCRPSTFLSSHPFALKKQSDDSAFRPESRRDLAERRPKRRQGSPAGTQLGRCHRGQPLRLGARTLRVGYRSWNRLFGHHRLQRVAIGPGLELPAHPSAGRDPRRGYGSPGRQGRPRKDRRCPLVDHRQANDQVQHCLALRP